MNHAELVAQLARGECEHLYTLRAQAIETRDAETFALAALRASHLANATITAPERWRAFTAALDAWPHDAPLGDAPTLEAALSEWSDRDRILPAHWLAAIIAGARLPFASIARSLSLSADTPEDLYAQFEGALRTLSRSAFGTLSLYQPKPLRGASDLSALSSLVARCEGLSHFSVCLPLRAADLTALLAASRKLGVPSMAFNVSPSLYRSLLQSKHLAGLRALSLSMNDDVAEPERAAALFDKLAASPALPTLETLALRHGGLDDAAMERLATLPLPALTSLDLSYNRFGAEGMSALTAARWWPSLRSLELNWVRKGNFDRLDDKGFAPVLARPPERLEALSLVGNGLRCVGSFVERLPHLTALHISSNQLAPDDAMALLSHPRLDTLELDGSSLREDSISKLAKEVTPGPSLRSLSLSIATERISSDLAFASIPWAKRVGLRSTPRVLSWLWGLPEMSLDYRVMNGRHEDDLATLAASPHLAQISKLRLSWEYQPEPASLRALITSPHVAALESLDLKLGEYWSARPLLASFSGVSLPSLRSLTLRELTGTTERELAEGRALALRSLAEEAQLPALRELNLRGSKLSASELSTLATGASLAALETLRYDGRTEGTLASFVDAAAEVVRARSLRELSLDVGAYPPGECAALRDPTWTRSLERLSLHIPWESLSSSLRFEAPRCRSLSLAYLPAGLLECFENLPVEELTLRFGYSAPGTLSTLSRWKLRSLSFPRSTLNAEQLAAMIGAEWLSSVERLDLSGCYWNDDSFAVFASSTKLASVQHLSLGQVGHIQDAVTRMLGSDALPSLRGLTFDPSMQRVDPTHNWKRARPGLKITTEYGERW